jgi:ABC-type nitrate/sulfonate/bicarbonate transport system substrate-binding protein
MKRFIFACAVIGGLASPAVLQAQQINLGYLPLLSHVSEHAEELGLFKKYNLDVKVTLFQNGPALAQAIMAGDFQAGEIGAPPMINLATQGAPFYFLTTGGINVGAIMIRPDDPSIHSFRDLKGKKIGQLASGTLTYMSLFLAARHFGLGRQDFQEIFVPFPQMGALLASKQVDAVYAWPPFDTLMEEAGQGKVLVHDTEWLAYEATNALAVSRPWADRHPDQVKALCMIWIETERWLHDHPDGEREQIVKRLKLPESVAKAANLPYWPRNGYQLMSGIWETYYLMVGTNQLRATANIADIIDDYWIKPAQRWITPAVEELGLQPDPYAKRLDNMALPDLPGPVAGFVDPWAR